MSCRYENVWGFNYPQSHLSVSVDIHYQGGTFLSSLEHQSLGKVSPDQEARESNEVGLQLRLNSGSESGEKIRDACHGKGNGSAITLMNEVPKNKE